MKTNSLLIFSVTALLAGCAVGPDYERPEIAAMPGTFDDVPAGWKAASPADHLDRGAWWKCFNDAQLNGLMERLEQANPNAAAALARLEQARTYSNSARAALSPSLIFHPSAEQSRSSMNDFNNNQPQQNRGGEHASYRLPLDLAWEIDLWGRVRRGREAVDADTQAAGAAYEGVLLSARAELAQNWFSLRSTDSEIEVVRETIALRREAFELIGRRADEGASSDLDVARADSELATAEAEIAALQRRREELVASIAMLIGQPAPGFTVPGNPLKNGPPRVPVGIPSEWLERRPDIAGAERMMAGASARIGQTKTALFPKITLDASLGMASRHTGNLLESASKFWSYGSGVSVPLLRRNILRDDVKRAEARYDELLADYRGTVLNGFREVDTALSSLRWLKVQEDAIARAAESSFRAAELANKRYKEGITSLLESIDADRTRLLTRRTQVQIRNQRYLDTIQLIKALGGGFDAVAR